jgi:hypothetical protein
MASTDTYGICAAQAHLELTAWFVGGTRVAVHMDCWIAAYERTSRSTGGRGLQLEHYPLAIAPVPPAHQHRD